MKARLAALGLLMFVIVGCDVQYQVPFIKLGLPPTQVAEKVPLDVAISVPEEAQTVSAEVQPGMIGVIPIGSLLKVAAQDILLPAFDKATVVHGTQYPPEANAILSVRPKDLVPTMPYCGILGCRIDLLGSFTITLLDPKGSPVWDTTVNSFKTETDGSPMASGIDLLGKAAAEVVAEASQRAVEAIAASPQVRKYAMTGAPPSPAITAIRAQAQVAAAETAEAKGDYAAAQAALRQALAAAPTAPAPVAAAVRLLHRLCDPEGAKELGAPVAKAHPDDPALQAALAGTGLTPDPKLCQAQALNREGVALARAQRLPEALAKFRAAREEAPGLVPKASYNAALLVEQAGQPAAAVQAYQEAARGFLAPADRQEAVSRLVALAQRAKLPVSDAADHHYRLGIVRVEQKRYPEAVTEFEAALAAAPWLTDAYYNLGLVYDFTGATANALQALRTYVRLAPQAPNVGAVKTKIVELEDKLGLTGSPGK